MRTNIPVYDVAGTTELSSALTILVEAVKALEKAQGIKYTILLSPSSVVTVMQCSTATETETLMKEPQSSSSSSSNKQPNCS